jgi:multidrug resistance efflux pump
MSEHNTLVPVPLHRRWREFRIRYLPILVFAAMAGVVALLWQEHVTPTQVVGLAVAEQYEIRSSRDGYVHALTKSRFDLVDADEVVLTLLPVDGDRLQAQLEVIRAEIQVVRAGLEPAIGSQRARIDYEELRLDLMNARIQLGADRLQRDYLQRQVERQEQLFDQHLVSLAEYEQLITDLAVQDLRIREGEKLLDDLQERVTRLAALWADEDGGPAAAIHAAITVKEKELEVLEAELAPTLVASPGAGIISDILRRNGEFVAAGEPILQVKERTLGYIVGYLRQPISRVPEPGAGVQVYAKSRKVVYEGIVAQVGFQLEPIHEALLRPGLNVEYALPIRIEIDTDAPILPGEIVDIRL